MFSIRSESGMTFTSCEWNENKGNEVKYKTKEEAQRELEIVKKIFLDEVFYIHKHLA